MNAFGLEQLAGDHYRELVVLAQADHAARTATVRRWRRTLGAVLVRAGVGMGVPRRRREPALRQARALLCQDC